MANALQSSAATISKHDAVTVTLSPIFCSYKPKAHCSSAHVVRTLCVHLSASAGR